MASTSAFAQWMDSGQEYGASFLAGMLDLPPAQEDLPFLRCCSVLATLSHAVYVHTADDVGSTSSIELPLPGPLHARATVRAKLHHFRQAATSADDADLAWPQQYGIWDVEGVGMVVAFRGTSSLEDVFIDANISPTPLSTAGSGEEADGLMAHGGFLEGAIRYAPAIVEVLTNHLGRPIWVTGHSLGGAYANCLMLHLLESKWAATLFAAGGGSVTFGAPMVLHAADSAAMYSALADLETHTGVGKLEMHNLVNNADIVPRLLGTSLDPVHEAVEGYFPSLKAVQQTARQFHPFGRYHFFLGSTLRTVPNPASGPPGSCSADSRLIQQQLGASGLWKSVFATNGRGGGVTHHSIMSYQERLATHMEALARRQPGDATQSVEDPAHLFDFSSQASSWDSGGTDFGRAAGSLAQEMAGRLGSAALTAMTQRWRAAAVTAPREAASGSQPSVSQGWMTMLTRSAAATPTATAGDLAGASDAGSSWFSSRRWTGSSPAAQPPDSWQDVGAAVGTAFLQYMQRDPGEAPPRGEQRQEEF